MFLNQVLCIPIIEWAAPSGFPAQQEPELYSQLRAAIDMLRCPGCGSLNYETTLFVFRSGIEKMIECRGCGAVHEELLGEETSGEEADDLLAFLPLLVSIDSPSDEDP